MSNRKWIGIIIIILSFAGVSTYLANQHARALNQEILNLKEEKIILKLENEGMKKSELAAPEEIGETVVNLITPNLRRSIRDRELVPVAGGTITSNTTTSNIPVPACPTDKPAEPQTIAVDKQITTDIFLGLTPQNQLFTKYQMDLLLTSGEWSEHTVYDESNSTSNIKYSEDIKKILDYVTNEPPRITWKFRPHEYWRMGWNVDVGYYCDLFARTTSTDTTYSFDYYSEQYIASSESNKGRSCAPRVGLGWGIQF